MHSWLNTLVHHPRDYHVLKAHVAHVSSYVRIIIQRWRLREGPAMHRSLFFSFVLCSAVVQCNKSACRLVGNPFLDLYHVAVLAIVEFGDNVGNFK